MRQSQSLLLACKNAIKLNRELTNPGLLAGLIYSAIYAGRWSGRERWARFLMTGLPLADSSFLHSIQEIMDEYVPDRTWRIESILSNRVYLSNGSVRVYVEPQAILSPLVPNEPAELRVSVINCNEMPGFVIRESARNEPLGAISRIYLAIKPMHYCFFLKFLACRLSDKKIRFKMKLLANPRYYFRSDAGVIYVESDDLRRAISCVRRAVADAGVRLRSIVPLLTRRIMPGMGVADEPTDVSAAGWSHGQWVTKLLTEALAQTEDPRKMVTLIYEKIAESGREPSRPWRRGVLVPGSRSRGLLSSGAR